MGTRALIVAGGADRSGAAHTTRVLFDENGWPPGAFSFIAEAMSSLPRLDRDARPLAGALAQFGGSPVDGYGVSGHPSVDSLEGPRDLSWVYVVDFHRKSVTVYGGGEEAKPGSAARIVGRGRSDPMDSITDWPEGEAADWARSSLDKAKERLAEAGWTVNAIPVPFERAAKERSLPDRAADEMAMLCRERGRTPLWMNPATGDIPLSKQRVEKVNSHWMLTTREDGVMCVHPKEAFPAGMSFEEGKGYVIGYQAGLGLFRPMRGRQQESSLSLAA